MRTDFFDYDLPPPLIAQAPCARRDQARLLVVRRAGGILSHHVFYELPELLARGDLLVLNDTRVVPARLVGHRAATGGRWEGLFLRELPDGAWELLCQTRGRLRPGESVLIDGCGTSSASSSWSRTEIEGRLEDAVKLEATRLCPDREEYSVRPDPGAGPAREQAATEAASLKLSLCARTREGHWLARPDKTASALKLLEDFGQVPLPPYIREGRAAAGDRDRYQTVFARQSGAVAAPTAGLHFTAEVFEGLERRGIGWTFVTLHVGLGTFQPIRVEEVSKHRMHRERGELSAAAAAAIAACRARGGRIVAVGTTSVRLLETVAASGSPRAWAGETDLFIYPPHDFRAVDALVTNFHLPRSSLLLLVSAFAGIDLIQQAYKTAIERQYRFYSYGDAMLII